MNSETEKDNILQIKRLSSDSVYFNNVFKKTEKLVSVTFYILSHTNVKDKYAHHVEAIKDRALKTHEVSLRTLALQPHEQEDGLRDFQYALVALESTLRIAEAAGLLTPDLLLLLVDQLDSVQRTLMNNYVPVAGLSLSAVPFTRPDVAKAPTPKRPTGERRPRRVNIPAGDISTDAYLVYSQMTDRAERIKTVLEAKPHATIKDIAEVITDVSEKTIQRELNSLIEKGQVLREGERRWSRYSVSK